MIFDFVLYYTKIREFIFKQVVKNSSLRYTLGGGLRFGLVLGWSLASKSWVLLATSRGMIDILLGTREP